MGGSSAFQAMLPCVQDAAGDYGTPISDATVAGYAAGNQARGETPIEGAVNTAKRLHNLRVGVLDDVDRCFVASAPGVSGRIIEALMKGASPNLWARLTGVVNAAKASATALGKGYGIGAFVWAQGEYNYDPVNGGDTTKAGYKAKLAQLWADFKADCVTGVSGQVLPPAFFTYQTNSSWTDTANDQTIGMAQWEFCQENAGCYLATPIYPFVDKGGHFDPNGARWFGNQVGKVIHRVVELRQDWKPLSPISAKVSGTLVTVDFHVPEPPLAFRPAYVGTTAVNYTNKGFAVLDDSGDVPLLDVRIVLDTIVEITCARALVGAVKVRYAAKATHNGNGNLFDSDPTVANDRYEYTAGSGQYPAADIAALVGKPYPLWNACIAFSLPATT